MDKTQWPNLELNNLGPNAGGAGGTSIEIHNTETGEKNQRSVPFTYDEFLAGANNEGDPQIRSYISNIMQSRSIHNRDERGFIRRGLLPQVRALIPDIYGVVVGEIPNLVAMAPNPLKMAGIGMRADDPRFVPYGERKSPLPEDWQATHGVEATRVHAETYLRNLGKHLEEKGVWNPVEFLGVDMSPETRNTWEKLLTMMVEFGGGGLQAKGVTTGIKWSNDFAKIALPIAKESLEELGEEALDPKNVKNIFDKIGEYYSFGTPAGRRHFREETAWGTAAAPIMMGGEFLAELAGAEEGGQQVAGVAGVFLGPPTATAFFKGLGHIPVLGRILSAPKASLIDPVARPENVARRFIARAFAGEPTRKGARIKVARVHDLLSAAITEGRHIMDEVSGLMFTTDELAFAEAGRLRMLQQDARRELSDLEYVGVDPDTMRMHPDESLEGVRGLSPEAAREHLIKERLARKAELEGELAKLQTDEDSLLQFGHFQKSVYQSASKDASLEQASKFFIRETQSYIDRTESYFNRLNNIFDTEIDKINFGGAPDPVGLDVPGQLNKDYENAVNQGIQPRYETTFRRLVREGYKEGIEPSELLFLDAPVAGKVSEAIDQARSDAAKTLLEDALKHADIRANDFIERVDFWAREKGYGGWEDVIELGGADKESLGKTIRGIYQDAERQWRAIETSVFQRIKGGDIPNRDPIVFPENSTGIRGEDIAGKTIEEVATDLILNRSKSEKWNPQEIPKYVAQWAGWESLVRAGKALEEAELASAVGTPRTTTGTIGRLETTKTNADAKVTEAKKALDRQLELDAEELPKIHDALNTYLSSIDTAYKGRHPHAPAILRHFLNDPEIDWAAFTNKKTGPRLVEAYLAALPKKVATEFGLKTERQIVNFTKNARKRLEEIIGADKVKEISAGKVTIYDVLGPTLAAMQGGGKEKIKILQKPFQVAVDFMAQINEIAPGGNVAGVKSQKLWNTLDIAEDKAKLAEGNLQTALKKLFGDFQDPETGAGTVIGRAGRFSEPTSLLDVQKQMSELFNLADQTKDSILKANALQLREMFSQLLVPGVFKNADASQLEAARDASRTAFRVMENTEPVLKRRPEQILEGDLPEHVVKPISRDTMRGGQRTSIEKFRTVTAEIPERIVKFVQEPDGTVKAVFNEDVLRPIDETSKRIFDEPDFPFEIKKVGKYDTDWEVALKQGAPTSEAGLDTIENILLEQLALTFPDTDTVTPATVDKFRSQWRVALNTLEKGGRTGDQSVVSMVREADDLAQNVNVIQGLLDTTSARKVQALIDEGVLNSALTADEYVNWMKDTRIRKAGETALKDVLGSASPGNFVYDFVRKMQRSSNPEPEIQQLLSVVKGNPVALKGFKASLIDTLWRESTSLRPSSQLVTGSLGKGTTFDPAKFRKMLEPGSNFRKLLIETYKNADGTSSNPKLLEGLDKMAAGAVEAHELQRAGRQLPIGDFASYEVYSNLGRIVGLGIAARFKFVNELYAAGAGGRIFRAVGEHLTGNTVKDMVIAASLDPRIAADFLKDVRNTEFLLPMLRRYIIDDLVLGVPRRIARMPGAATQVITEPVEESPPPAMGPRSSLQLPTNINADSTLSQVQPLAAARPQPLGPPPQQLAATGTPRPETMAGLAEVGLPLFPALASKGGLASIRKKKKSRQMVY